MSLRRNSVNVRTSCNALRELGAEAGGILWEGVGKRGWWGGSGKLRAEVVAWLCGGLLEQIAEKLDGELSKDSSADPGS